MDRLRRQAAVLMDDRKYYLRGGQALLKLTSLHAGCFLGLVRINHLPREMVIIMGRTRHF
jgi:hypothetical protein